MDNINSNGKILFYKFKYLQSLQVMASQLAIPPSDGIIDTIFKKVYFSWSV